jgi:hypothetical protein
MASDSFYVGWDVGGWHCDSNPKSRDGVVVLDAALAVSGTPWRGNLREAINRARTGEEFIEEVASVCETTPLSKASEVVLAIDAPLGFSQQFVELVSRSYAVQNDVGIISGNPYLYRETERFLFEHGITPLSPIKDMIGSQATKAQHVLARCTPIVRSCGVWSDSGRLTAIEAYPASCRNSTLLKSYLTNRKPMRHRDLDDALVCSLIAFMYATRREDLQQPDLRTPVSEGWIWVPKDVLKGS